MEFMKLLLWNVNGLRAVHNKKLFIPWFKKEKADIVCLNETKLQEDQVPPELKDIKGYNSFFSCAEKKGYSGTAIWTKIPPKDVSKELGIKKFDTEGRLLRIDLEDLTLFTIYFPNGGMSEERLKFKLNYDAFYDHIQKLKKQGRKIIICGDVNTAHTEIDLARPKENSDTTGFLPIERKWLDKLFSNGFVDTFRIFNEKGENYTYWDYKTLARDRNVGWRIDYFIVSENLKDKVISSYIQSDVVGSDHCPIALELKF